MWEKEQSQNFELWVCCYTTKPPQFGGLLVGWFFCVCVVGGFYFVLFFLTSTEFIELILFYLGQVTIKL